MRPVERAAREAACAQPMFPYILAARRILPRDAGD
jgi:hypothetical protein